MEEVIGRVPSGQALAVPATPANAVDGPAGVDPSRREFLNLARAFRQRENQLLHDCANAFASPQPAGEEYHFQRLLAWDVLISDLQDGIPLPKAKLMFAALSERTGA